MTNKLKDNRGMALVICLLIMTVAAMMAIGIATSSTIDVKISRNQRDIEKAFFIGDGTNQVKIGKILTDDTLAPKILTAPEVKNDGTATETLADLDDLPTPPKYRARISYIYRRAVSPGFSIENSKSFKFYYYTVRTNARRNDRNEVGIKTTEKKLGI